jgi:hypothetical protein
MHLEVCCAAPLLFRLVLFSLLTLTLAISPSRKPTLDILNGIDLPTTLRTAIQSIDFASILHEQRANQAQLAIRYDISKGKSALRDLAEPERALLLCGATNESPPILPKTVQAILLLCLFQRSDAAHEVILGVTRDKLEDAEYAATHPGQTTWSQDHPLTDVDDMVHSLMHRLCEGSLTGEGGYRGWENAAYWAAGGPKCRFAIPSSSEPEQHPVRSALACAASEHAPHCIRAGVVRNAGNEDSRRHCIIAGGGSTRHVSVPLGCWDPFCFIALIQRSCGASLDPDMERELDWLQELELRLLLRFELMRAVGIRLDDSTESILKSLLVYHEL